MSTELESLKKNKTWILVELPKNRKAISNKWVFTTKRDGQGLEIRKKARLVIKGFYQKEGIDYFETFAPVVSVASLRLLIAVYEATLDWNSIQIDVKTAFLYGTLKEEIYMTQPEGFIEPGKEHLVCKLLKSLYGLKQAPRVWNEEIKSTLTRIGFKQAICDNGIFIHKTRNIVLGIWVDDMPAFFKLEADKNWLIKEIEKNMKLSIVI